jgi:hypothetical protein
VRNSPAELIENDRALAMRKGMLDLVAETSERRKTELAIDAIVKRVAEGLVCNVTSFEQHNSNERAASLSDEMGSPRFLGKFGDDDKQGSG